MDYYISIGNEFLAYILADYISWCKVILVCVVGLSVTLLPDRWNGEVLE